MKINFEGIIDSKAYVFDGYAKDEKKVLGILTDVVKEMEVPLEVSLQKFKSGGFLSGTSNEMILVTYANLSPTYNVCIGLNPFGQYLGVNLYLIAEAGAFKKLATTATNLAFDMKVSTQSRHLVGSKDIFQARDVSAYWSAVDSCLQETFNRLKFSEVTKGFLGLN